MSEQSKSGSEFEVTQEELEFIRQLRNATAPLTEAEIGILKGRRERGEAGQAAVDGPVTLESIKPGMSSAERDRIFRHVHRIAR